MMGSWCEAEAVCVRGQERFECLEIPTGRAAEVILAQVGSLKA